MNWKEISKVEELDEIVNQSKKKLVLIFKHSTRCSTSALALNRLEREWKEEEMSSVVPCFLNLIQYREVSNEVANRFGVQHQSPQVLVIRDGKSIHDASHFLINYSDIKKLSGEFSVN